LTYELLTGGVEHVAQPSVVALSVDLSQMVLIHVELQEADLSDLAAGREPLLKYISD
jgi:hypothetical protein